MPLQLKNHVWLFVNCLVENPTFDSQTKENMTLQAKKFGSTAPLSDKFLKAVSETAHEKIDQIDGLEILVLEILSSSDQEIW